MAVNGRTTDCPTFTRGPVKVTGLVLVCDQPAGRVPVAAYDIPAGSGSVTVTS